MKFNMNWMYVFILVMLVAVLFTNTREAPNNDKSWTEFLTLFKDNVFSKITVNESDRKVTAVVKPNQISRVFPQGLPEQNNFWKGATEPSTKVSIPSSDRSV